MEPDNEFDFCETQQELGIPSEESDNLNQLYTAAEEYAGQNPGCFKTVKGHMEKLTAAKRDLAAGKITQVGFDELFAKEVELWALWATKLKKQKSNANSAFQTPKKSPTASAAGMTTESPLRGQDLTALLQAAGAAAETAEPSTEGGIKSTSLMDQIECAVKQATTDEVLTNTTASNEQCKEMFKKPGLNPTPNSAGFIAQNAPEVLTKLNEAKLCLNQPASSAEETAENNKKAVAAISIALKHTGNLVMMAHHAGHIYGGDLDVAIKSIYDKFGDTMTGLLAKQQRVVMELRKAHSQNTTPVKRTAPQEAVGVQQTSSPPFKRQQRGNGGRGRWGYNGNIRNRSEPQ